MKPKKVDTRQELYDIYQLNGGASLCNPYKLESAAGLVCLSRWNAGGVAYYYLDNLKELERVALKFDNAARLVFHDVWSIYESEKGVKG